MDYNRHRRRDAVNKPGERAGCAQGLSHVSGGSAVARQEFLRREERGPAPMLAAFPKIMSANCEQQCLFFVPPHIFTAENAEIRGENDILQNDSAPLRALCGENTPLRFCVNLVFYQRI